MPLAQKLTKKKARKKLPIQGPDINRKGHNTAVAGGSGKAGTLITPKIDVTKITKDKEFQEQLYSLIDDIEITEDDIPDEMLDDWYELQDELKPALVEKNWLLWATLFSAVVLPGIVQGTRSEPTVKQPAVIIKGKQQEPIPPLEPRQIVNYSQEYFKEHGLELCKSLTETDLTRLKGDLIQNWNKGEDAFAKAFKESYPVSKQRLETIYRSERHMAEYHGVMKRAERAGHSYKQWRAVGDERTCDECMQYDMQIVPIGEPFSNGAMTANAHVNCYSSDTEVFTENGWKLFKDVDPSEKIWTFNLQSRMMELDTQKSQISYPYNGNMIHLKNKSLDCLVTPDHNMIVKSAWNFLNRPESSFVFKKASELSNSDRIPVTSEWQGKNIATIDINGHKFPADKFMSFMGWYISEGSICKPKKTDWQIHITQTKPENKQEIYDLCKSLFPVVYNCIDYICIAHVGDIKNYFIRLGHSHEKYIPNKLKNLSQDLLKHFFDSYIKGDGSISNNKWNGYEQYNYGHSITASTNSIKLINDLTEIGMKLGYSISYSIRHPKPIFFKRNNKTYTAKYDQHVIRFNKHKNRCFYKHIMKEIPYNDMVYCLEMEHNHSLFVRRNNKTNWSGNCRCSMVSLTDDEFDEMPDEQFSDENLPDNDEEWDEEMKQDAAHLNDAFEFIKLNYRCEENPPGSGNFKCDVTQQSDKSLDKINKTRLKELKVALKDTKTRNQNIRDQMDKVRRDSPEWKNLQKQIDIDSEYKLKDSIKTLQYKHPDVPKEFESFLSDSDTIIKNLTPEENQELNLYVTGFGNAHYQSMLAKLDGKLPENVDEYVKELVGKKWNYDTGKFDPNDAIMQKEYKNTMEYVIGRINKIKIIDSIMDKSRTPNDIIIRTGISSALFDINELSPGDEFEVPTYLSTSRSDKVANGFALRKYTMDMKNYKERPHANKIPTIPTILEIRLSKGSKAIALENFVLQSQGANAEYVIGDKGVAGTGSQQEILLARGTKFKIKEISETEFRGKKIRKVIVDGSN